MLIEVVAAALVRDGRVLAARRAGRADGWEFPGGKVEPAETREDALVRELAEELQLRAVIGEAVGQADDGRIRLVLFQADAVDEPRPGADHDQLRWVKAAELDDIAWLPIDRELIPAVRALLERGGQS